MNSAMCEVHRDRGSNDAGSTGQLMRIPERSDLVLSEWGRAFKANLPFPNPVVEISRVSRAFKLTLGEMGYISLTGMRRALFI